LLFPYFYLYILKILEKGNGLIVIEITADGFLRFMVRNIVGTLVMMKDIGTSDMIVTTLSDDLNSVLKKFTTKNIDSLPVVQEDDHGILIGMLRRREVISFYNEQVKKMKMGNH